MTTQLTERQLVRIRAQAMAKRGPFVDPFVINQSLRVLDRRGEQWAREVLGRDISRRSIAKPNRPWLKDGEEYALVLADQAEDQAALGEDAEERWRDMEQEEDE